MAFNIVTQTKQFIPKWNDNDKNTNPITVNLKPLNTKSYWQIMAICQSIQDNQNINPNEIPEIIENLRPIFQKNIESISNLTIDNKQMQSGDIVNYPALIELMTEIMFELINISSFTDKDKKKSVKQ